MALQKQTIPLTLTKGLSTKVDPKAIQAGVPILENATFISPGRLKKRNGYAEVGAAPVAGTLASTMPLLTSNGLQNSGTKAAMVFQDQLLSATTDSLRTYDAAASNWTTLAGAGSGGFYSAVVAKQSVSRNSYSASSPDMAVLNGLQLTAWEDAQNGPRVVYSLLDTVTGSVVKPPTSIGTKFFSPKCLAYGSNLFILAISNIDTRIYGSVVSSAGAVSMVPLTPASGLSKAKFGSFPDFDATVVQTASGARLYIVYNDSSTGEVLSTVPLVISNGGISYWYSVAATPTARAGGGQLVRGDPGTSLTVFGDLKNQAPVVAFWNGVSVYFRAYDIAMSTLLASGTLETGVASVGRITGVSLSASALSWQIFYTVKGAAPLTTFNDSVRSNTVTGSYIPGVAHEFMRSVSVIGKAFAYAGRAMVPVMHTSTLQPTIFVIAANGSAQGYVVAKVLSGLIGSLSVTGILPETVALSSTEFQFAALEKDLFTTNSGAIYTQNGVDAISLDLDDSSTYQRAELGNNLHVSGGFVQSYDGLNVVEHGFHLFPENVSATTTGAGFNYHYVACYEWMDNQGNWHRSAPSPSLAVTEIAVISGGDPVTVTIPTLRVTAKQGTLESPSRSPVICAVYRTINNGTSFFLAGLITSMPLSATDADTVTFEDSTTDANLLGNPILYTTGGVVENIAPNPCTAMVVGGNRVWGIDSLTGAVFYSKQVIPGSPVEFSDLLTFNVDQRGGAPTALGVLDEKKVIFRESTISYLAGIGPDSTGAQADLAEYFVQSDVGCVNPRSVVATPAGLMFDSAKGKYLLDRSLQVSYIGADVEGYNSSTVTSAVLAPNTTQVRFTLNSGVALVYDYFVGQWSVFTNISAVDAIVYNGEYSYAGASGIFQETPGLFADPTATFIRMRVVTSWLQFAQMQGFQRIRRLLILGDWLSAHNLTVKLSFDFATTETQTDTISSPTTVTPLQHRIHLSQQKCEALKISIEDVSSGTNGESLSLSGLMLEVGVKSGPFRMPAAKSYG